MSKYVIVDLEMCNVPNATKGKFPLKQELIQIGAVVVDESFKITSDFMTYVSPEFGRIDPYIEQLTGISQKDVCGAPRVKEALERFLNWLPEDAILVSWSTSDEMQIRKEVQAKGIVFEQLNDYLENWVDCQKIFGEKMNGKKVYKLSEALNIANINYEDGAHDALVDAKNTAQLFIKMQCESELVLNPYYSTGVKQMTYNPFMQLLKDYNFAS